MGTWQRGDACFPDCWGLIYTCQAVVALAGLSELATSVGTSLKERALAVGGGWVTVFEKDAVKLCCGPDRRPSPTMVPWSLERPTAVSDSFSSDSFSTIGLE